MPQSPPRPSGWVTRDYKDDGSLIDIKSKNIDIAFVYMVILLCVGIAVFGMLDQMNRAGDRVMWKWTLVGAVGSVIAGIVFYLLYVSIQVKRVRIDERGVIFTVGKSLRGKLAWNQISAVRCYERQGGVAMNREVRGIEFVPTGGEKTILGELKTMRMESEDFKQESLDKSVRVIKFYEKKHDFVAHLDEWETDEKNVLVRPRSD